MRCGGKDSVFTNPMEEAVYSVCRIYTCAIVDIDIYKLCNTRSTTVWTKVLTSECTTDGGMLNTAAFLRLGRRGDLHGLNLKVVGQV